MPESVCFVTYNVNFNGSEAILLKTRFVRCVIEPPLLRCTTPNTKNTLQNRGQNSKPPRLQTTPCT